MTSTQKPDLSWATRMGDLLRDEMERQGLSRAELARQAGLHIRSLQRWTRGECLTVTALERVCGALGLDVEVRLVPRDQGEKQVPEVKPVTKERRRKAPAPSTQAVAGEDRLADPELLTLLERLATQDGLSSAEWIRRTLLQQVRLQARKSGFR